MRCSRFGTGPFNSRVKKHYFSIDQPINTLNPLYRNYNFPLNVKFFCLINLSALFILLRSFEQQLYSRRISITVLFFNLIRSKHLRLIVLLEQRHPKKFSKAQNS